MDESLRFASWPDAEDAPFAGYVIDGRTVVFGSASAWGMAVRVGARGVWLPTSEDVARAHAALPVNRSSQATRLGRQWSGVVLDGRRALFGNFFTFEGDIASSPWRSHPVRAGREFAVLFDLETGVLTELPADPAAR